MSVRRLPLLSRVKSESLRRSAEACFELADAIAARRAELDRSNKFTAEGKAAELADALRQEFSPKLRAAQLPIVNAMQDIDRRTRSLSLPAPDPANIAAALERQEIRAMLRAMPLLERSQLVFDTKDNRIIEAVLTAPCELSSIPPDRFERLLNIQREKLHGQAVAEIKETQSDVDEARACIEVATGDIQRNSGIEEREFSKIVGNEKQGAKWLKRDGDDRIVVIVPGESIANLATAQDVATGKFYLNFEEYNRDRPDGVRPYVAEAAE